MATCINLAERFGDRFRVTFEAGYDAKGLHNPDPWMMEIRGRFGIIYPHGGDMLAVMVDRHPAARRHLSGLPGCRQVQAGEHESTFLFAAADFPKVAAVVKPHRKPRMSEAQREAAKERLKAFQFQPGHETHAATA